MKPVLFNNTVLRDGHQSLAATRMKTDQMLPVAPELDQLGFHGLETWGGAVIDSCLRYLEENPFTRLRTLKQAAPKTPHIMLLRGQNIVQYTSFADDVVTAFVNCSAKAGVDVFRIFDALNDVRNLQTAIKAVLAAGKHARGEICYTTSPVHTTQAFIKMGIELEKMGCQSIGLKDMAGLIKPQVAAELVRELKKVVGIPIVLHTHDTAGLGASSYMAATEAGIDVVETSVVPFANGTGQPDTLRMQAILEGHPRCPNYNPEALRKIQGYLEGVYKELGKFTSGANERVDADILTYQVPGGMLSNFRTQLKELGMADKYEEVLKEIPYVRACLGYIPLVTPTSQIVGTQAMLNVKFGRWKNISAQAMDIALGKYGKTPGPIDSEVLAQIEAKTGQKPTTERPADLLPPGLPKLREQLRAKGLPEDDETAVLFAMFPQQVESLLKPKPAPAPAPAVVAPAPAPAPAPAAAPALVAPPPAARPALGNGQVRRFAVTVNGVRREVTVKEV